MNHWTAGAKWWGGVFGAWLALGQPELIRAQAVLNEVLVDNRTAISNGDEFPDYVELFNPASQTVSLAGF